MKFAIKTRVIGSPQLTAEQAVRRLRGNTDWGALQRQEGWSCPYCRQPVFLKGSHERTNGSRSYRVEAHFSHYSRSQDLLCLLMSPGTGRISSELLSEGIDHQQLLNLFYSIPETVDKNPWPCSLAREEACHIANILDSIGIGSVEEDAEINPAFRSKSDPPLSLGETVASVVAAGNYEAGLIGFGLESLVALSDGALSKPGRPNAIRGFFISAGSVRKAYFQKVHRDGLLESHLEIVRDRYKEAASLWSANKQLPIYLSSFFGLLGELVRVSIGDSDRKAPVSLSALRYIALLPWIPFRASEVEVVNLLRVSASEERASSRRNRIRGGAFVSNSKKDLIFPDSLVKAVACTPARQGYQSFFLDWSTSEHYRTDSYYVIPVEGGVFLASRLQYSGGSGHPVAELRLENLQSESLARNAQWDYKVEITPSPQGGLRVPREILKSLLDRAGIGREAVTRGPCDCIPSARGVLIDFASRAIQ